MKRFGLGIASSGLVAIGFVFSIGIVSIGMNAVGWIAIGMNAVGFVSVGAVNSIGVFAYGGVNAGGGWGGGGVNAGFSDAGGLAITVAVLAVTVAMRIKTWPRRDPSLFVALARAADEEKAWALVRVVGGDANGLVLQDASATLRVELGEALRGATGRPPALARVRLRRAVRATSESGYREDPAFHVVEVTELVAERHGLGALFGDTVGVQLACALAGACAAVAAFVSTP